MALSEENYHTLFDDKGARYKSSVHHRELIYTFRIALNPNMALSEENYHTLFDYKRARYKIYVHHRELIVIQDSIKPILGHVYDNMAPVHQKGISEYSETVPLISIR